MKSRILRVLFLGALLFLFAGLGYYSFGWWQARQKRKELFDYLQKSSPVMKKLPAQTSVYLNLYDAKRVHESLQGTQLYRVFAHWLDTGLADGDRKPNPVVGSMLEKTALNLLGEEFAVGLIPVPKRRPDIIAIARITPGSDLVLKIALASDKKLQRVAYGEQYIYVVPTKNIDYPEFSLYLDSDYAYASNNVELVRQSVSGKGAGPAFLQQTGEGSLPEDTFLLVRSQEPVVAAYAFGGERNYHFNMESSAALPGTIPDLSRGNATVFSMRTNLPQIFHQPCAGYSLQYSHGDSVSALLLSFINQDRAAKFEQKALERWEGKMEVARKGGLLLIGDLSIDPQEFLQDGPARPKGKQPVTLQVTTDRGRLSEFADRITKDDWSLFPRGKAFYFLSCVKQVQGAIDGAHHELILDLD